MTSEVLATCDEPLPDGRGSVSCHTLSAPTQSRDRQEAVPACVSIACALLLTAFSATAADHVIVYRETGRYGGWPANHGMWSWGDEILVGFSQTYYKQRHPGSPSGRCR